ncbi:MAG TPA: HNH endonuclease signature motif containing protein [bacterium]|nr:HNH endonuclease signature motif containing protein [bacterium]
MSIENLSSAAITARLRALLEQGRQVDVEFLVHLAEFDRRRAWAEFGYGSLWDYCKRELKLLDCATFHRTNAAKILQRVPEAVEYLRDGRMGMTTLVVLKDVLEETNARELLDRASWKSRDEVKEIVASLREPAPVPAASIRRLPGAATLEVAEIASPTERKSDAACTPAEATEIEPPRDARSAGSIDGRIAMIEPGRLLETRRPEIEPVARDQYSVRFVVDRDFIETLKKVRSLESHAVPDGDVVTLLRRGLEALVRKHETKKGPKRTKPRARKSAEVGTSPAPSNATPAKQIGVRAPGPGAPSNSVASAPPTDRAISLNARRTAVPAEVERAVWERDEGRCVWETASGRCGSTWQVEKDHIVPEALGGESTVENMRLLCRDHNEQHARDVFGDAWIEHCKSEGPRRSRERREKRRRRSTQRLLP